MASQTPPPHLNHPNKAARARFARDTINNIIPQILQHNTRAHLGNASTERIYYEQGSPNNKKSSSNRENGPGQKPKPSPSTITGYFKPLDKNPTTELRPSNQLKSDPTLEQQGSRAPKFSTDEKDDDIDRQGGAQASNSLGTVSSKTQPKITVIQSDTLDAARAFVNPNAKDRRIAILNMASFLRPGGGVVNGAIAQEESLCLRSTLYTALDEKFYRLPKYGGLFTKDILVFRDSDNQNLLKADWYWVDVISVAALKSPDLVKTADGKEVYEHEQEREEMISKIKLILLTALKHKSTHLILGALGCGAYHNPPEEVAKMFRRVIFGDKRGRGAMDLAGIEEIVFAIFDDGVNLRVFREVLGDQQATQSNPGNKVYDDGAKNSEESGRDVEMTDVAGKIV